MKALGIVRRMDGLGRVVVPAEVRKTMNWATNAPLEMFTQGDALVIKKYRTNEEKSKLLNELREATNNTSEKRTRKTIDKAIEYIEQA